MDSRENPPQVVRDLPEPNKVRNLLVTSQGKATEAYLAHNQSVTGSNPVPATNQSALVFVKFAMHRL